MKTLIYCYEAEGHRHEHQVDGGLDWNYAFEPVPPIGVPRLGQALTWCVDDDGRLCFEGWA